MYDIEKYYEAADIKDAIAALEADSEAIVISGGSDVLVQIREGRHAGCSLVSIHGIEELKEIRMDDEGSILIGGAAVFSHITNNTLIQDCIPVLGEAVDMVGGPQIRNMGTIGGNVCNGVTSADSASTLFAHNAVLILEGPKGEREVSIHDFYTGPGRTVREHGEILRWIKITKENYAGYAGQYIKYGKRNAMEIATLGCSVNVKLSGDKSRIEDVRISYGVAGPTPLRCPNTEAEVRGKAVSRELLEIIGKGVLKEVNPRTSWRASKEFRLQLIEELGKRGFIQAVIRGGGSIDA